MAQHDFSDQLKRGKRGEAFLDRYFSLWYQVEAVSLQEEKMRGYDRIFRNLYPNFEYLAKAPTRLMRVEYKTDYRVAQTGNVFIETVSVDTKNKKGWIYTSQAHLLVYFIPPLYRIYCCPMKGVREAFLSDWQRRYATGGAVNADYTTNGVLVPLPVFAAIAKRTIQL